MNFLKKWKLYSQYKRIVKDNQISLKEKFKIKVDFVNRMYTVVNIPPQEIGDAYDLKKSDIEILSERFVREYVKNLYTYFTQIGLNEMVEFYGSIQKIDKYSYLIVIGFKFFRTDEFNKLVWYRILPFLFITSLIIFVTYRIFG